MSTPIGRHIRARRAALGLKQEELAAALGVSRVTIARYEAGERRPSADSFAELATALDTDVSRLTALSAGVERALVSAVQERAPLTPVECDIGEMLSRVPAVQPIHDAVREALGEGRYDDLGASFLRQTPWELALGFAALHAGGELRWTSPLEAGSRVLNVGEDKRAYEGHLLRLAVSWKGENDAIVLLPQISILTPQIDKRYRVDYLAVHHAPGLPSASVAVELDGSPHDWQGTGDRLRVEDLRLPVVRFDNHAVTRPNFFAWLVGRIRQKADAARISSGEYARYVKRRRRRYDKSA